MIQWILVSHSVAVFWRVLALALFAWVAPAYGQDLSRLGFTLDGRVVRPWVQTPLGVVSEEDYVMWWLTLRGDLRAEAEPTAVRMVTAAVLEP